MRGCSSKLECNSVAKIKFSTYISIPKIRDVMKKFILLVFIVLLGCNKESIEKENVFVSILPQKFFVEKIAGEDFEVHAMVRPGMSPATYEPLPNQLIELSKSKIYFAIGVPFEKVLLKKINSTFENVHIVKTQDRIKLREVGSTKSKTKKYDPHIWLNPLLVKVQAENILAGLVKLRPERKDFYEKNYYNFINEIDSVNLKISEILSDLETKKFLIYHPSFGYFCDEYGLKQFAIEKKGKEPTGNAVAEIMDLIERENLKLLFVQKQFTSKLSEKISNITGIKIVQVDPLSGDYFNNLIRVANIIAGNTYETIN